MPSEIEALKPQIPKATSAITDNAVIGIAGKCRAAYGVVCIHCYVSDELHHLCDAAESAITECVGGGV